MAIPSDAKVFQEVMDPYDVLDFQVDLNPLLEVGEAVDTYNISVPAESTLFGLEIKTTDGYVVDLTDNTLTFYLGVILAEQANIAFDAGVTLPIEISIITNSIPARRKQRTVAVIVRQR